MTVTVYGSSDDLIEIEGDIREEFYAPTEGPAMLGFSDGTLLSIEYNSDGVWKITRRDRGHSTKLSIDYAEGPDTDNYSDRATIDADIKWVVMGTNWGPALSPPLGEVVRLT